LESGLACPAQVRVLDLCSKDLMRANIVFSQTEDHVERSKVE